MSAAAVRREWNGERKTLFLKKGLTGGAGLWLNGGTVEGVSDAHTSRETGSKDHPSPAVMPGLPFYHFLLFA